MRQLYRIARRVVGALIRRLDLLFFLRALYHGFGFSKSLSRALLGKTTRALYKNLWLPAYIVTIWLCFPFNWVLVGLVREKAVPNSVFHISRSGHVPDDFVQILRNRGIHAEYLALGHNPHWHKYDYNLCDKLIPMFSALRDLYFFWKIIARHEVVHSHFLLGPFIIGWEWPWLRRLGRRVVFHARGCEVRDRKRLLAVHGRNAICADCDYDPQICVSSENRKRRQAMNTYADVKLVTTPDLSDFIPGAEHLPLFLPTALPAPADRPSWSPDQGRPLKIVHATNHPGIEGSDVIRRVIAALVREEGWPIDFVYLRGVGHERVLAELVDADLAIGKMKMGYYANAQIESMALGVPAITRIRQDFMTGDLKESAFIFCTLDGLRDMIGDLLRHPEKLAAKREKARQSILRLHDNDEIVRRLIRLYGWGDRPEWQEFLGRAEGA